MRLSLIGLAFASMLVASCAQTHWTWSPESISQEDFVRLAYETQAENERVRHAAYAGLTRQGIALTPDQALRLTPTEPLFRSCQDLPSPVPAGASGWFVLDKAPPLQAPLKEACRFLDPFGPPELDVQRSDGTKGRLLRLQDHQWVAHDAKGDVVVVNVFVHTTTKRVEVKTDDCMERMPQTKPDERHDALLWNVRAVWHPKTAIRTVDLRYEIKELDSVCGKVCCSR